MIFDGAVQLAIFMFWGWEISGRDTHNFDRDFSITPTSATETTVCFGGVFAHASPRL